MINRNLTIESGLAELGEIEDAFGKDYPPGCELARALKEFDEKVRGAIRVGDATVALSGLGNTLHFAPQVDTDKAKKIDNARRTLNRSLEMGDPFSTFWTRLTWQQTGDVVHLCNELMSVLSESRMNAVEHGTHYCTIGDVTVRGVLSRKGTLFCIIQSGPGPTTEQLDRLYQNTPSDDLRYSDGLLMRGNGFTKYVQAPGTEVNFQTLPNGLCALISKLEIPIAPLQK